jgi:hypothetical protein
MTPDLTAAILAALALGAAAGWLTAMRYGQPPAPAAPATPLSAAEIRALKEAFTNLFAQFIDNTTVVVGGLQEDINGLREAVEKVSAWAPGQELENPAQLTRWMGESSRDRAELRRQLAAQRRWIVALTVAVAAGLPMITLIFVRVIYLVFWGGR